MTAANNHLKWVCLAVCFLFVSTIAIAQGLVAGEYFFDEDPGLGMGTEILLTPAQVQDFEFTASVGTLEAGYHSFSVRFKDAESKWGIAQTTAFYINGTAAELPPQPPLTSIVSGEYFWASDPGPGNGIPLDVAVGLTTNVLSTIEVPVNADENILGVRFKDLSGTWGTAQHFTLDLIDNTLTDSPFQDFSFAPNPATAGNNINFLDQSTGLDPNVLIQWDVDGDNQPDYFGSAIQHSYTEDGIYPVRQTVVNESSALAQSADVQFYFRDGSLADQAGTFDDLTSEFTPSQILGRAGDAFGALQTGPIILTTEAANQSVDAFTVSFWVRGEDFKNIVQIGDSTGFQFRAFSNPNEHFLGGVPIEAGEASDLYDGFWHHIAVRYDNGFAQSFLDGDLVQGRPANISAPFNLNLLTIGGTSQIDFAEGTLDDLTFFQRHLTDQEIEILALETYSSSLIKDVQVGNVVEYSVSVNGNTTFCSGNSVQLTAPPADAYLWNTGEATQSISVSEAGSYLCQLTLSNNLFVTNSTEITVLPTPQVVLTSNDATNGQNNGSAAVEISGGSSLFYDILWSSGSTLGFIENLNSGNYDVDITDGVCPVSIDFSIGNSTPGESPRIVAAEYFFGPDPGPGNATAFSIPEGQETGTFFGIPAPSELQPGDQAVFSFRTRDNLGNWSTTKTEPIFILDEIETEISEPFDLVFAEYFIDNEDPGVGQATPLPAFSPGIEPEVSANIPTDGLSTGPHLLTVRFKDADGTWGIATTEDFSIEFQIPPTLPEELLTIVEAEYFIGDEDPGTGMATSIPIQPTTSLDVQRIADSSELPEGEYRVSVRTRDITGQWSTTKSQLFEIIAVACVVPSADFTFNSANAGEQIIFTNTSQNANGQTDFSWDIDADGTTDFSSVNISLTPPTPGVYEVKLTADNGEECVTSIIKEVEVGPLFTTDLMADGPTEFCQGETVTLSAPNGSEYFWNTLETSQSILVSELGNYSCTYMDQNGNPALSSSVEVIVNPTISVDTFVSNATNGSANGSALVSGSGGNTFTYEYSWSDGFDGQINTELSPGNYTVTVTDGICPETASIEILNGSIPSVNLVEGEYFFGDDPGVGNGSALVIPQDVEINAFLDVSTAGLVPGYYPFSTRFKRNDGSWGIAKTIPVSLFDPNPEVVDTLPSTIVEAEYFLNSDDPGPGNATDTEPFTSNQEVLATAIIETLALNLEPGPVKVNTRVKDANGNWSFTKSQDFFIEVEPAPNLSDTEWPLVAAEYFIGNDDPGPGMANPLAFNLGSEVNINESIDLGGLSFGPKKVTIRVKDGNDKWSVAKTLNFDIVSVNCPVPNVSFSNSSPIVGGNLNLQNTSTNTLTNATYSWDLNEDGSQDASGQTAQIATPESGSYFVTLTVDNGDGCFASDTREIFVGPVLDNSITADGSLTFCEGQSVVLQAPSGSNYLWNTEETTESITVASSGTYSVSYTDLAGVLSSSESVSVTVSPSLEVQTFVNNPTNGNSNGSAGVFVSGGSQFTYGYSWSSGENTALITDKAAGSYTVEISDQFCPELIELDLVEEIINPELVIAEYFWGSDPGVGGGIEIAIPEIDETSLYASIETDGLDIGYHFLSVRVQEDNGSWGVSQTIPVYLGDPNPITPPPASADLVELEYFIDADPSIGSGTIQPIGPSSSVSVDIDIPVAALLPGPHIVSSRVRNADGEWGIANASSFEICNPPSVPTLILETQSVCLGGTITLKAESDMNTTLNWITPQGVSFPADSVVLSDVSLADGGIYQVFAEGDPGCFSATNSFELEVLLPPVISTLITGPSVICNTEESAQLFIPPVEFATNYNWIFPEGAEIIGGNNTNNISLDFSSVFDSEALIGLVVDNICGSDTASSYLLSFECDVVLPPNDACNQLNASFLLNCEEEVEGSTFGATPTPSLSSLCDGSDSESANDVWYAFQADGLLSYTITVDTNANTSDSQMNAVLFVYNGNCNSLNEVACADENFNGSGFSGESITLETPSAGTYYVRLFDSFGRDESFEITLSCNDNCDSPFPAVGNSSLTTSFTGNSFLLGWEPVLGQIGCQVGVRIANGQNLGQVIVGGANASSFNVPGSALNLGTDYEWRVRCGCSQTPLVVGPWSDWVPFSTPGGSSIMSWPNPTVGNSSVTFVIANESYSTLEVVDINGKVIERLFSGVANSEQQYRFDFDGSRLPNGIYIYRLRTEDEIRNEKFVIAR